MKRPSFPALLLASLCGLAMAGTAQAQSTSPATAPAKPAWPAARPADVASMNAIIHAVYDVISGPAG